MIKAERPYLAHVRLEKPIFLGLLTITKDAYITLPAQSRGEAIVKAYLQPAIESCLLAAKGYTLDVIDAVEI